MFNFWYWFLMDDDYIYVYILYWIFMDDSSNGLECVSAPIDTEITLAMGT
jgi:hypothetical protein